METYVIAAAIIKSNGKYLIGKRSENKKFSPSQWEFISGFIEEKESAEETIIREIKEEVRLDAKILKKGPPCVVEDSEARWIILPFIVEADASRAILNKEDHSELKLASLDELKSIKDLEDQVRAFESAGIL